MIATPEPPTAHQRPSSAVYFWAIDLPGQPLPAPTQPFLPTADGFSLHAGVAAGADERQKVERLCRYIARPAIATGRLSLTAQGQVRYTLKTPYRDGTTHVVFEPLDFIARLAALEPKPRAPDARRPHAGRAAPGHDLGATAEAGVRHRDRDLRAMRGQGPGDRQHRGPGGDREDSRARGGAGGAGGLAAARAGAATGDVGFAVRG